MIKRGVGIAKVLLVAVEGIHAIGGTILREAFILGKGSKWLAFGILAHALIERGKEKVLQNGLIVGRGIGRKIFENIFQISLGEELLGDKALFLEEPTEDETSQQTDQASGTAFLVVLLDVGREIDLRKRPEVPVGKLAVEALVEQLNVEDFFPGRMQLVEILDAALVCREFGQREGGQNVQMPRVWLVDGDVLDEGDLAQHIPIFVALVETTVDYRQRQQATNFEQHHDRHGKNAVDLACNASQLASGVITLAQLDGDEHVGLQERGADGIVLEQCCAASKLFICELKKQFGALPLPD